MLNVQDHLDNISEESIYTYLNFFNFDIGNNDYNKFIGFLKSNYLATQYICTTSKDKAISFLQKLTKSFKLDILQFDELYNLIKINGSLSTKRISGWEIKKVKVISQDDNTLNVFHYSSSYVDTNIWGYVSAEMTIKFYFHNKNIIWIGHNIDEPQYFVLKGSNLYGIKYRHKQLTIINNLLNTSSENIISDNPNIDDILSKYGYINKRLGEISIDLTDHFYKGFFYKGLLFDRNWKTDISTIKYIGFYGDLLKFEIENLTYPKNDYILLDIDSGKIVDKPSLKPMME